MSRRDDRLSAAAGDRRWRWRGTTLAAAAAALVCEAWARWPAGGGSRPLLELVGLACLALTCALLAGEALRARRLARGAWRAASGGAGEGASPRQAATADSGSLPTDELPLLVFALGADGRFERFNSRWLEVVGCSEGELETMRFADLLAADGLAAWRDLEAKILAGSSVPSFATALVARGGRLLYVEGSAWPRRAPEPHGIAGSLVDVTARRDAEEARAQAEESFRRLFLRNPAASYLSTADGRFLDCNESFLLLLGFASREEALATPFESLLPVPEDRHRLLAALRRDGRLDNVETRLRRRNGEVITVHESISWERGADGVEILEGIALDITPRLAAESALRVAAEALRESEARYRNIFENGLGFLCTHDLDGRLLSVNPAAAGALGATPAELVGRSLADFLAPAVRGGLAAYLESIRRGGQAEGVMRLAARDGEKRLWMYRNVLHSPAAAAPYVLGFAFDVTESWQARNAVAVSERRFRRFLEASGDLIQSLDAEGRLEYVNRQWRETLGYSAKEARALRFQDFVASRELEHCGTLFERLRAGDVSGAVETVFVARDGREVHVQGTVSSSFEDGRFVSCQGFFRDVTQRRALEEQRRAYLDRIQHQNLELELNRKEAVRANRLKSEFLATMSHELRTPLNAILGFSELLAEDPLQPLVEQQTFYLGFVRKSAEHLLRLINDILDLSKIEAGRLKLSPEELRVAALLPEVLSTVGPLAAQKRIRLGQSVPESLTVFADRLHFKQILFNLLSNAVKFTPGEGTIKVVGESEEGFSLLAVSNTGSLVEPADQEAIFDEFQQARGRAEAREGTGLGLAIVRRLVEQHGGKVWVESSPLADTTFVVMLPERGEPAAAPPPNPPSLPRAQRAGGEPAILLFSDDEASRTRWVAVLQRQRFSVRAVPCAGAALPQADASQPQLAILDLAGSGACGWRLLAELRASRRPVRPLVLALAPDVASKRRAFLGGAHGCLALPADDELLVKACRRRIEPFDSPRVVLVVEADPERQRLLTEAAIAAGFRPVVVAAGKDAVHTADHLRPQAIVLDLHLPDLDGYQTIVRLRSNPATAQIPVLLLAKQGADVIETQAFSGPTRLLWLADGDWREVVAGEIQRTVDAEIWLPANAALEAAGR